MTIALSILVTSCTNNTPVVAERKEEAKGQSLSSSSLDYPDTPKETDDAGNKEIDKKELLDEYRNESVTVRYGFYQSPTDQDWYLNYYIIDFAEIVDINFKFCKGYLDENNNVLDSYAFEEGEEFKMYFTQYTFSNPRIFNATYIFVE